MGRRARIAKVEANGEIRSIHIQWADPVFQGSVLLDVFNTEKKVDDLLDYGYLESLSKIEGNPEDYPDSYGGQPFGAIVVQPEDKIHKIDGGFIRIRQFSGEHKADIDKDFTAFDSGGYDMERYFVFCDNKWWISLKDIGRTIPLETIFELLALPSANLLKGRNK